MANSAQSGLKIFTTLDPIAQRKAESSVQEKLSALEKARQIDGLQGAMVISSINTGEIRALVGNREVNYHGFNRALDARRPIGSLIKPAVYLTALEQAADYHLASPLQDQPISLKSSKGRLWQPQNADKTFRGQVPLLSALTQSLNVPTVNLGMAVGLDKVADTLQRLGVERAIKEVPALTLGSLDLTPLEVNQMYQTLANNGQRIDLHSITAVLNADNKPVWTANQFPQFAFENEPVYLVNYALHKVTLEGTAKEIRRVFPAILISGKTRLISLAVPSNVTLCRA